MTEAITVLTKIVQDKKQWIEARKQQQPLTHILAHIQPSDREFYRALRQDRTVFILECKKASPSKGLIRADFDVAEIAKTYRPYASVISVLTDETFFQGQFEFIATVREHAPQPVLCKDFIIDPYQVYLARYYQADAILLMLSVLDDETYLTLSSLAQSLNMGILTEVSTEEELDRAIMLNAPVIGINNRNLRDLSISLSRTREFAPKIPADRVIISESGIHSHAQVRELSPFVDGFLVGSALMSERDIATAVRRLMFGDNKVCGLTDAAAVKAAYDNGAVYGGLIFAPDSPRAVTFDQAKSLMSIAPLNWVGVFRDATHDEIIQIANSLNLDAVQLHGARDNDLSTLRQHLAPTCQIWLAVAADQVQFAALPAHANRYVLDNGRGGTGKTFDWYKLQHSAIDLNQAMLAGGIHIGNIDAALAVGCMGVDLNSGVENAPGQKCPAKIQAIFSHIRQY